MRFRVISLVLGLFLPTAAGAVTIRVPLNYTTIKAAVDASAEGDIVLVAPGNYIESFTLQSKTIRLVSEGGASVTNVSPPSNSSRILEFIGSGNKTEVDGFTFSNSTTNAILISGALTPLIHNCVFHHFSSEAILVTQGSPTISRNIFYQNSGISCIGVYGGSGTTSIYNNTFDRNARGFYSLLNTTKAENNIVYKSGYYGIYGSYAELDYNDSYGNAYDYMNASPGPHDISLDPQFVDTATHDYGLKVGSPCRDAGNPDPQFNDIDGSRSDIGRGPTVSGVYPLPSTITLSPGLPPAVTAPDFDISWFFLDSLGRKQTAYEIEVGTDDDWTLAEMWATGQILTTDTVVAYGGSPLAEGQTYFIRVRVSDSLGWGDWVSRWFFAHFTTTLRVPSVYTSIQAAINISVPGDTILVAPGEYVENITYFSHKVRLISESGAAATIIRAQNTGQPAVQFINVEDTLSVISGFTVKGGTNSSAIYCQGASPIIENCDLTAIATGGSAKGVHLRNSQAIIRSNRIHHNCYGIFGDNCSYIQISYNEIYANTGTVSAAAIVLYSSQYGHYLVHHNLIHHNFAPPSSVKVFWLAGPNSKVYNNTVVFNSDGLYADFDSGDSLFNNIIAFNQNVGLLRSSAWHDYNNVYQNGSNNIAGPHGISAEPIFVDSSNLDYSLQASSPCVDAGIPDTTYNDPDGTRGDMGAIFKLQDEPPIAARLSITPGEQLVVFSATPSIHWKFFDVPASTPGGYEIEVGSDTDWSTAEYWASGPVASADTFAVFGGQPLEANLPYVLRIRLFNGTSWGDWREWEFGVYLGGSWRVPAHSKRISTLMSLAHSGDSIIVSPGTYFDNFAFLGKAVTVTSDSGWQNAIIQSQSSGRPVVEIKSNEGRGSILEKLSIRGARNAVGIQIANASPTIRDCEVTDNQDAFGGISVNGGGPLIDSCKIHHNVASSPGAAIAGTVNAPTEISRNLIYENGGAGGGGIMISVNAALDIHHNVLFRNHGSTASSAAIGLGYGSGIVRNNTLISNFWGIQATNSSAHILNNIVTDSYNDAITGDAAFIDFNDTWNNGRNYAPSGGNMQSDPLFADTTAFDFSLLPESPCIDAGDPDSSYFDPDGSRADMGAIARNQTGLARVTNLTLPNEALTRVAAPLPVFSWSSIFPGGSQQQAFEVQVGRDQDWDWVDLWEPGAITSTDTSVKYAGIPLRDGMQVYARLRVFDGTVWTSWYGLNFHMDNRPAVPVLAYPGDTTLVPFYKPDLAAVVGTDKDGDHQSLIFELYRDSALQNVRVTSPFVPDTTGTVVWTETAPLLENYHYWWRVKSYDGYMYSDWTLPRSFWINQLAQVPTAAVLGSPPEIGNEPEYDLTPTFTWSEAVDPDPKDTVFYTLQLSLNESFTLAFTYPGLLVKTFTLEDSLPVGTTFWWRVNSTDRDGHATMSLPLQFTTWRLGDVDHSGYPDLADLIRLIDFLYISGNPITPIWAGDVDGDCHVDISDITRMIDYLYLTFRPLDQGCSVSQMTGQRFLQRIGVVKKPPQAEAATTKSDTQ